MEEIVRQFGHLPQLYEDARSEKYILKNCHHFVFIATAARA